MTGRTLRGGGHHRRRGDSNVVLLDADGKLVEQCRAGHRWVNEVTVPADGRFVAALVTTPEGTAVDSPRFYAFRQGGT